MAQRRRRSNYHRMTPARRKALRKAQLASARKRKRRDVAKKVGLGVAALSAYSVTRYSARWAGDFRQMGRDIRDAKQFARNINNKRKRLVAKARSKQANVRLKRSAKKNQQYTLW